MKPPLKVVLISTALTLGLLALAWTGTFLYWHLRISRDLRTIERRDEVKGEKADDERRTASHSLTLAGCRAVPYLIAAMDPSKDGPFLRAASYIVTAQSADAEARRTGIRTNEQIQRLNDWVIMPWDPPADRRRRIDLMRAWWGDHRTEYHPWWEVWSTKCDGFPVGD